MDAEYLLTFVSRTFFLFLGIKTAFDYLYHRDPIRRDIAWMVASIAIPVGAAVIRSFTKFPDWLGTLSSLPLLAQPYLLIRLIAYLQPLPSQLKQIVWGGMLFSMISYLILGESISSVFILLIVIYFVLADGYAMYALVRGALSTSGVVQRRLQSTALGSGMLVIILFLTGLRYFLPVLQTLFTSINQMLAIVAATGFYIGFAPPLWLQKLWQFTELRAYLVHIGLLSRSHQLSGNDLLRELCLVASRVCGSKGSLVLNRDPQVSLWYLMASDADYPLDIQPLSQESIIAQVWSDQTARSIHSNRPINTVDQALLDRTQSEIILVVPIATSEHQMGLLVVLREHSSLFPEDDLALLELLAQQTAIFLENRQLLEQVQRYSEDLEQTIQARTLALRESEARYRSIFAQAAVGIAYKSINMTFIDVNQRFCDITGYTPSELKTLTVPDITHPDDLALERTYMDALLAGQSSSYTMQKRYIRQGDSIVWTNLTTSLVKNASGEPEYFIAIIEDMTERRQAEDAKHEIETRYTRVLETMAEAVITIDATQKIMLFNHSAEHMFGYSATEIVGQSLSRLLPPEVVQRHHQFIRAFAEGDDISRGMGQRDRELTARHKNGTIFPIEASISKLTERDDTILTVFIRDVTEQKHAREALLQSESRYHRIIDNMLEGFQILGPDWQYLYVNDAAVRFGRLSREDLLGHTVPEKYPGIESSDMFAAMQHCMETRQAQIAEFEFTYPDGTVAWFQLSIQPVPEGISILSLDVTERKQAEERLQQLNAELEQRVADRTVQLQATNKELEAFSYSVSHDLRAPLRAVDGFSQALLEDYHDQLDEEGQEFLTLVRTESQRMGQLIDDLLDLSRLTRTVLSRELVNLSEIAQEIAQELQTQAHERQVDFVIAEPLWACADRGLIRIALQNLLSNAWKYSSKNAVARIEFGSTTAGSERLFFVRDDGVGFNMAYAHKLFGAFQRLHSVSEFEGTGIGLATVQRVVHQHGGRIYAEAELDKGATFYFTIGSQECE